MRALTADKDASWRDALMCRNVARGARRTIECMRKPLHWILAAACLLAALPGRGEIAAGPPEMAAAYRAQVDRALDVPAPEARRYVQLAQAAFARAEIAVTAAQYVAVVDRDPYVQVIFIYFIAAVDGEWQLIGASPVSTGRPGAFDHFETPIGVFEHSLANPDFRAEGTLNENGIRGYGAKGMRVFDLGWQLVPKGWGDGARIEMRLQMHATDADLLERRLGSAQSKGCIRIPASLNKLLDRYGLLDADYFAALEQGRELWVLDAHREPAAWPGRWVVVVDSQRTDRPEWSPGPFIPHVRPKR